MHTSRKRTHFTNAGLLTAVTLSMCLLAGCNGARFLMGGDPTQPVNPAATNTPGATAPQGRTLTVRGTASLSTGALANASVKVFDAVTNMPAQVIAAGGANVVAAGGANVVAAGGANFAVLQAGKRPAPQIGAASFSTDAEGKFSIPVGNMQPGMVIRLVVTANGKTVSTLITGSGKALMGTKANYEVLQDGNVVDAPVNPATHAGAQVLNSIVSLTGSLTPEASDAIVDNSLDQVNTDVMPQIIANQNDPSIQALTENTNANGQSPAAAVTTALTTAGVADQTAKITDQGKTSVAEQEANPSNRAGGVDTTPPGGTENPGEQPGVTEPQQPDGITEDPNAGIGDPNVAPVVSDASFNPTVLVKRTPNLTIKVSQPLGSDDISTVYARVAKASGMSLNTAIDSTSSITVNASGLGSFPFTFEATASKAVDLPPRFGGGKLSSTAMSYNLKKSGMTSPVAHFQVFETSSYYYLVTSYLLSDAVRTNGGHTTTLSTTALSGLTDATKIEITLTSRGGNSVDRTNGVTDTF